MIDVNFTGVRNLSIDIIPVGETESSPGERMLDLEIEMQGQTVRLTLASGSSELQDKFVDLFRAWEKISCEP
jgi:hypothetical protein